VTRRLSEVKRDDLVKTEVVDAYLGKYGLEKKNQSF